jgi:hypothetical protein
MKRRGRELDLALFAALNKLRETFDVDLDALDRALKFALLHMRADAEEQRRK